MSLSFSSWNVVTACWWFLLSFLIFILLQRLSFSRFILQLVLFFPQTGNYNSSGLTFLIFFLFWGRARKLFSLLQTATGSIFLFLFLRQFGCYIFFFLYSSWLKVINTGFHSCQELEENNRETSILHVPVLKKNNILIHIRHNFHENYKPKNRSYKKTKRKRFFEKIKRRMDSCDFSFSQVWNPSSG